MIGIIAFIRSPIGKALGIALALGLAILLFNLWLDGQRDQAVTDDRAAANAEAVNAAAGALVNATEAQAARDADFDNRQSQDRKAIDDAKADNRSALDVLFPSR